MLKFERLEDRANPSPLIPGWDGPELHTIAQLDAGPYLDTVAVAGDGGSCRVYAISGDTGEVLINTILYDPNFRGGGGGLEVVGKSILVVPGPGGGPVVDQLDFAGTVTASFFAPYSEEFRGGLKVSSGDVNMDGRVDAIFLPGEGGGPELVAVDLETHETLAAIWVGDPSDTSGSAAFEPTGGMLGVPHAFIVQYGDVVDAHVPTRLWAPDGTEVFL